MEKYSSGWRGAPAKGVGRLRGARVQSPPSPLFCCSKSGDLRITKKKNKKEKLLTNEKWYDNMSSVAKQSNKVN